MRMHDGEHLFARTRITTALMLIGLVVAGGPGTAVPPLGQQLASTDDSALRSLDDAIRFVRDRRAAMSEITDYIATFKKTEAVDGKVIEQAMSMKFRQRPFSVYLRYKAGRERGRQVLYVEGANDNQLLVRERGLLASLAGTVTLEVGNPQVRAENRYAITEIGIRGILDRSLANWKSEQSADADNVEVEFLPDSSIESMDCEAMEVRRRRPGPEFPYSVTRVYFEKRSKLAVGAEQYGWPSAEGEKAPLLERYTYSDVKTNVGLTDADFDPGNPKYGFKAAAR